MLEMRGVYAWREVGRIDSEVNAGVVRMGIDCKEKRGPLSPRFVFVVLDKAPAYPRIRQKRVKSANDHCSAS